MVSLIARDEEAKALHAELKNTRKALKDSPPNVKLPESREFFWSKIEHDLQRLAPLRTAVPTISLFERLRRLLIPMGALAALVLAGLFTYNELSLGSRSGAFEMDMAMADSNAFTYQDYTAGMTLVWLPYPAENDLARNASPSTMP